MRTPYPTEVFTPYRLSEATSQIADGELLRTKVLRRRFHGDNLPSRGCFASCLARDSQVEATLTAHRICVTATLRPVTGSLAERNA